MSSLLVIAVFATTILQSSQHACFQRQYALDDFILDKTFKDVTDIAINHKEQHVVVLQRSYPPVTIWSTDGKLLFKWDTQEIGYPHSLTLNATSGNSDETTVWITDMAGKLAAGKAYGHCIKQFTYTGRFIQSIGNCSSHTNGSGLRPVQFDRVTDLALNSKGYIYVTDGDIGGVNNRVLVFDPNFKLVDVWNKWNQPGSGPLQFNLPHSIHIDWCDRVWITDAKNHRIQIISSDGTFLSEWKCFNNSLIYGIDINHSFDSAFVVVTAKRADGQSEIIFLPIELNDCSQLARIGVCTVQRRLVIKKSSQNPSTMLHSVALDNRSGDLYLSMLPGNFPPIKYSPIPLPPKNELNACPDTLRPVDLWPATWSANVLLTPYHVDDLHTARVEYNGDLQAMHIFLYGPDGKVEEYLNVGNATYIITRNSTIVTCSGPDDYGWLTPARDWLAPYKCECKGALNISGIETVAWTCPVYGQREWYWLHSSNGSIWRMMLNNPRTPNSLPVIGKYTMAHFIYETSDPLLLKNVYTMCTGKPRRRYNPTIPIKAQPVKGFSYAGCTTFPNWPEFFHSTVTMIPVSIDSATPLPTQVIYDWEKESQRTIMCEGKQTYNAYMIHNSTYIMNKNLESETLECLSHFSFGPPKPNWMTGDSCICKGSIHDNLALAPWNNTVIAVCPVTDTRVFWTWFTKDNGFSPLLFFETLTPANEGTGLALADYHTIHNGDILIDLKELEVPPKCRV